MSRWLAGAALTLSPLLVGGCGTCARDEILSREVRELLRKQVELGAFPGAVALVAHRGCVLVKVAVGRQTYTKGSAPITEDTVYDLASLTKVCATLPAMAVLLGRGTISLEDRLDKWVPEFRGAGKEAVTLRHLMVHSSGLPAYIRFFHKGVKGKANFIAACAKTELRYRPGEKKVYSDLGVILLMAVVQRASGKSLDRFVAEEIYPTLGVTACFGEAGVLVDAAPTENDPWRGRVVRGEVHDENAFAMGGVSGHAGLFGTASDVARIGQCFLDGGSGLFPPSLAAKLCRRDGMVTGSTRALLWDTFKKGESGGSRLSPGAFGHTGFTGTSVWCDPESGLCMVLLTNRVHPTRANRKISAARRAFHDLVADALARD